jgi:purine catabolism regulator
MAFTVRELLELPVLRDARPEVLVGGDLDTRAVRWVHTSEIYEIWPLLKGGEVLLTTGLGLVGVPPEATADYVRSLAQKDVAALLLELGRTFTRPPAALVDAAAEHDLPLVLLHGVVPFIEVTETVHPLLLDHQVDRHRELERASSQLNRVLLEGHGMHELVATIAGICHAPVGVYGLDRSLLAGTDVASAPVSFQVNVGTGPWATLVVAAVDGPERHRLAELCAGSLGVFMAHRSRLSPTPRTAAADLLRDLASGRYVPSADIVSRAAALGLTARPGHRLVALVVRTTTPTSVRTGSEVTIEAARRVLGASPAADLDGDVVIAAALPFTELRARLSTLVEAIDAELRATVGGSVSRLTAGPLVEDVAGLARSVPEALAAAALAAKLSLGSRIVLTSDLGVYNLLSSVVADVEVERFVDEQLGPLLEHDARTGSDLVPTLDAYLEAGLSKTAAAAALGIRRQTLYARLERIGRLLGGLGFDERQRRTALDLALVSWRMRSSAPGHRPR